MVNLKNGNVENSILTLEPKFGHTAAEAVAEYVAAMKDKKSFIIVADLLAISPKDDDFLANCGMDFVHIDTITGSYGSINKQFREAIDRGDNIIVDANSIDFVAYMPLEEYILLMPAEATSVKNYLKMSRGYGNVILYDNKILNNS